MDKFQLINVFVAVVEAKSLVGAARHLKISAPAVTRAINALEVHLGLRVLQRSTRALKLTEAGAQYFQDCKRILMDLKEAEDSLDGMHLATRGHLTITAPVLFGNMHVMPIVNEFLNRYPHMSMDSLFLDRVVNLLVEEIDIAIRIGELPDSSMQAIRVGQVGLLFCASPDYLRQNGPPMHPNDLQQHQCVLASCVTPAPEWRWMEKGVVQSVKLQPRLKVITNDAAIAAALDGIGITRLLSYQVDAHIKSGRLVTLLNDFPATILPVHLVHREGRQVANRIRAFIDMAVDRLRANQALQYTP